MRLIDAEKLNREVKEHCKKLIDEGVKEVDVVDIAAEIVTGDRCPDGICRK